MIYLYALAGELSDVSDLRGVQEEALVLVPVDDALIVGGDVAAAPPLDAATLKAQDALVRRLHDRAAALLPMRFGTTAVDAAAATRTIGARESLLARLARVRGCEQMTARLLGAGHQPPDADVAITSGRQYLESRRAGRRASPELDAIAHAAEALQRAVRVEPAVQAGLHGSVYHLIERGCADEYRAAVDRAAARLPGVRVIVTGPSPAYAFG